MDRQESYSFRVLFSLFLFFFASRAIGYRCHGNAEKRVTRTAYGPAVVVFSSFQSCYHSAIHFKLVHEASCLQLGMKRGMLRHRSSCPAAGPLRFHENRTAARSLTFPSRSRSLVEEKDELVPANDNRLRAEGDGPKKRRRKKKSHNVSVKRRCRRNGTQIRTYRQKRKLGRIGTIPADPGSREFSGQANETAAEPVAI